MSECPIPLNSAEAIFQRFWDPHRHGLDSWQTAGVPSRDLKIQHHVCMAKVTWETGSGVVGRMTRDLDLLIGEYDRLSFCASLPSSTRLTVRAIVDGFQQTPINAASGENTYVEYEGPLAGSHIERLDIELDDTASRPGAAFLVWMGLFHSARRETMRERMRISQSCWQDLVVPSGVSREPAPTLGLLFDESDIPALRRKVSAGPYKALMDKFRKKAASYLGTEPWRGVSTYPNPRHPRCGRMNEPLDIDPLAMRLCAFVGLIDNNEELCRTALDHALALAHCDYWVADFLDTFPGSTWEHRAFYPYRLAVNLIFAWDWAGGLLNKAGVTALAQAVSLKGLPWMLATLMRHPYVRGCNQGAYFAYGAIACEIALAKVWKHGDELLDKAIAALDETVNNYFSEDGGAFEGPGYVTSTIGHALAAYLMAARHRGVSLKDIAPERLGRTAGYLTTMISTAPPFGSCINVGDGGRPGATIYPECLGGLAALGDDPAVPALMAGLAQQPDLTENFATPGSVFNIVFGPNDLPSPQAQPKTFSLLSHVGMLCSCRQAQGGLVRLQLIGGPANAGHSHEDRGSFVIEAFGEEIAIDRGQISYDKPGACIMGMARYHNLLIPENEDSRLCRQRSPCREATIPQGAGDNRKLHAEIEAGAAWDAPVTRWRRKIDSPEPERFTITDEMDLDEPQAASFVLHSRFPWNKSDSGWITQGNHARLTIRPDWQPIDESGEEDPVDPSEAPVYRLRLRAARSRQHRLRVELKISPVE